MLKKIQIRAVVDNNKVDQLTILALQEKLQNMQGIEILNVPNIERSKGDDITILTLGIAIVSGTVPAIISLAPAIWEILKPKFEITVANEKTGVTLTGKADNLEKLEELKNVLQKMAED